MDEETPEPGPPRRDSTRLFLLFMFPLILITVWALFRYGFGPAGDDVVLSPERAAAFNMREAPQVERAPAAPPAVATPRQPARPAGGLSGFVAEPMDRLSGPQAGLSGDKERAFLAQHGRELRQYTSRLDSIAMKYYKKYPIVRKVDEDFGGLSRYMAVRQQYYKDGDPYAFARKTLALPEVRQKVLKYMLDTEVWKVAIGMSLEALRNPPPKPIYDEMKHFVITDKTMVNFLNDMGQAAAPKIPEVLMAVGKDGTDLRPLQQLVEELNAPIRAQAQSSR